MFQNMVYRPTVYKTGIFPNVNDALKDKDIFPMDIETMDLLLNVAVATQLFEEYFNPKKNLSQLNNQKRLAQEIVDFSNPIASFQESLLNNKEVASLHCTESAQL